MKWSEPKIKSDVCPVPPYKFNVRGYSPIAAHEVPLSTSFVHVLEKRSSRRRMRFVDKTLLGQLLYLSSRTKQVDKNELGIIIEKKNHASAGAMASVYTIFTELKSDKWYVYNPRSHSEGELIIAENTRLKKLKKEAVAFIPDAKNGLLLWYVADITRLSCKYTHPEALALRESGAIAATHNLVAEYLGMAYSQLGLNGFSEASSISNERQLLGVGMAFLGTPISR